MIEKARRDLILDAADRLLRHYGPQKTTMADVAREVNIGVGTVYLDFPSKEALVEELSRRRYALVLDQMRKERARFAGAPASERLAKVLEARTVGFLAIEAGGAHEREILHCVGDATRPARSGYLAEERAIITEILADGARSGELRIDDLEVTVRAVLHAYVAFAAPLVFRGDRRNLDADMAAMHRLVLRGLSRREGEGHAAVREKAGAVKRKRSGPRG